jgi:hypothetical protein
LIWAASFVWTAYSGHPRASALTTAYAFISGGLYLFVGAILLLSKNFAVEFERLRNAGSARKAHFRKLFVIAVGAAVVIAFSQFLINEWRDYQNR